MLELLSLIKSVKLRLPSLSVWRMINVKLCRTFSLSFQHYCSFFSEVLTAIRIHCSGQFPATCLCYGGAAVMVRWALNW